MPKELSTPVTVEQDGWTLSSGSSDQPTESSLRAALSDEQGSTPAPPEEKEPPPEAVREPEPLTDEPEQGEPTTEQPEVAEPEEAPAATAAKQRRRTHDPQRRIDQMNAQLAQEREARIRAETELTVLRRQPVAPAAPQAVPQEPPAPSGPPPITKKPAWGGAEGYEAQGKSWEEYEDDKSAWNRQELQAEAQRLVDERFAAERSRAEQQRGQMIAESSQRAADKAFLDRVNAVRAKRPDYDAVIDRLGNLASPPLQHLIYTSPEGPHIGLYLAENMDQAQVLTELPWSKPIVDTIKRSNVPVKLLKHFADHPEEVDQLAQQDFVSAIAAIGRLEARLDVGHTVTTGAAPPVTRARPPLRTVGGGAPTARTSASAGNDLEFGPEYVQQGNREDWSKQQRRRGF